MAERNANKCGCGGWLDETEICSKCGTDYFRLRLLEQKMAVKSSVLEALKPEAITTKTLVLITGFGLN